ncbi:MAG: RNA polymerase sigma factor [Planctomycetota bacterium]|nr:RNA polymerase sigma factor [Planctomycetota bacterium]
MAKADEHTQMLLRARKGDSQAFAGLYAALSPAVRDFTISLDGQLAPHDHEELVQEVFLRAWETRSAYRGEASAKTWLFSIAKNVFYERLRRRQRDSALVEAARREAVSRRPTDPPQVQAGLAESIKAFCRIQSQLPPSLRQALQLVVVEGNSIAKAADKAGCSVGAMYQRLHEARKRLRELSDEPC